jgi:hypothetical protein
MLLALVGCSDRDRGSSTIPDLRAPAWDADAGRGLFIVDALTAGRWGWFAADTGKCVWAEIVRAAAEPVSKEPLSF